MPEHDFWLSDAQFARLQPLLPNKVRGVPRVDDRKVISGISHVIRYGLRWREALAERGVKSCIPGRANRKEPIVCDTELYKRRNLIERLFGRLKDCRRIATRYDRCAHTFFSAICIAATVSFWL